MALNARQLEAAIHALRHGDVQTAQHALQALGAGAAWALAALRQDMGLHGAARTAAFRSLARALGRTLAATPAAPVDRARLASIAAQNRSIYDGLSERVLRAVSAFLGHVLGAALQWLGADHHALIVVVVLSAVLLVWVALRLGGLLPSGAAHAIYTSDRASKGPSALWREAQEQWRRGNRLQALANGRAAVVARLDEAGLLRAVPGISDREIERKLSSSPLAGPAGEFRRTYAYGRWSAGREDALRDAWEQLGRLWRAGGERR